jgi:hypothetical protein
MGIFRCRFKFSLLSLPYPTLHSLKTLTHLINLTTRLLHLLENTPRVTSRVGNFQSLGLAKKHLQIPQQRSYFSIRQDVWGSRFSSNLLRTGSFLSFLFSLYFILSLISFHLTSHLISKQWQEDR